MQIGIEAGAHTFALAAELGVCGVPIDGAQLAKQGVAHTLAPLTERNLRVCQIGAFGFNALNVDMQQKQMLETIIPLAGATGCPYIVIGPGNYSANAFGATDRRNFSAPALDEMARTLEPLLALAEAHGATLSIEAYLKGAIHSTGSFLDLWQRVQSPALTVNIDPSSLYDFRDFVDPAPLVEDICTKLAGHYGLVHIKEVALADEFHLHAGLAPVGSGATNWAQFLRLIAPHVPAAGWVVVEHILSMDEGRATWAQLKNAAKEAGVAW
jgi:sugar phosphate isomerase/epimerase